MERLTTDKPNGMYELAHNSCYVGDDGTARYRDFETDIDARAFAKNLLLASGYDDFPWDDDDFDEELMENLMYDAFTDNRGLIALFYRNLWAMADLRERLKAYEDAEEQGLLLRLPCKVGDTVYGTSSYIDCDEEQCVNINFCECEEDVRCEHLIRKYFVKKINFHVQTLAEFGKTVFLTKEEAEAALAKMESEV